MSHVDTGTAKAIPARPCGTPPICLFVDTGMRPGGLAALAVHDIDFDQMLERYTAPVAVERARAADNKLSLDDDRT